MIFVRLEGGLGNQLFQYAAARRLATRHGTSLRLDASTYLSKQRRITPRGLELRHFRIEADVTTEKCLRCLPLARRFPGLWSRLTGLSIYIEQGLQFNPHFDTLPDNTYLIGYWQSHRYFADIAPTLARELEGAQALSATNIGLADRAMTEPSVAIHVRRGDYASLPSAASLHGTLPLSYYTAALAHIRQQVSDPRFFIFSDDIEWCRANLPLARDEATFVENNHGDDAWQDLLLMGYCRHHVIANSSFSWWGAWLADRRHTHRCVVAPAQWFRIQAPHDTADRFPQHWSVL